MELRGRISLFLSRWNLRHWQHIYVKNSRQPFGKVSLQLGRKVGIRELPGYITYIVDINGHVLKKERNKQKSQLPE